MSVEPTAEAPPAAPVSHSPAETAVSDAAWAYAAARLNGDAGRVAGALHPEAQLRRVQRDHTAGAFLELDGASKAVRRAAAGTPARRGPEAEPRVELLDRFCLVATAKVVDARGVEYLQLARFGDDWRVVSVLATDSVTDAAAADGSPATAGEDYALGWYGPDAERMERSVHPEMVKRCVRLDASGVAYADYVGYTELLRWTAAERDVVPESDRWFEVTVLDRFRDIAAVRVAWREQGLDSRDYLLVASLDDTWRIVSILWEWDRAGLDDAFGRAWPHGWHREA
jgi:Putative lumazine-binding